MAKTSHDMVEEFRAFIDYIGEISVIDDEILQRPIAEGKWSVKDILSHIMLWDKYFYEEAIEKIKLGQPLTVRHLNFDEFNANAVEYAKTQTKDALIDQFIVYRTNIINSVSGLSEDECLQGYKDGDKKKFTIRGYLCGFVAHDKHHKKQIASYLTSLK